jgi:hypothetical protein
MKTVGVLHACAELSGIRRVRQKSLVHRSMMERRAAYSLTDADMRQHRLQGGFVMGL